MNHVVVSTDRRQMVIFGPLGQEAIMRSARPGGFSTVDEERAQAWVWREGMADGQKSVAIRTEWRGWEAFLGLYTGPPTWWVPRIGFRAVGARVGWLRAAVAVRLGRARKVK